MPQLSLYFDDATLKRVEKAAKLSRVSTSKWVRGRLMRSLEDEWPDDYFDLFASIQDDSFERPEDVPDRPSMSREKL